VLELSLRFLLIGAIAFGGGQAALPLVERLAVHDTGWVTSQQFATGVGLSYATPGPVLILSAFIGYHVGGVVGAVVAALSVFAIPVVLAGGAAQVTGLLKDRPWFNAFGRFAAAAAIGLLGITLLSLAAPLLDVHPGLIAGSVALATLALLGWHPILLLAGATALGGATAVLMQPV
jgi:chromate transporter